MPKIGGNVFDHRYGFSLGKVPEMSAGYAGGNGGKGYCKMVLSSKIELAIPSEIAPETGRATPGRKG